MNARRTPFALLLVLLAACTTPPPPAPVLLPPPAVHWLARGPRADAAGLAIAATAWRVALPLAGTAVEAAARRITSTRGTPFRAISSLPAGTVVQQPATTPSPADTADSAAASAPLASDLDAVLDFGRDLPQLRATMTAEGALELALEHRDGTRLETIHLREPLTAGGSLWLFVPASPAASTGVAIHIAHAGPATAEALHTPRTQAHASAPVAVPATAWSLARQAIGETSLRPALLALARTARSERAADVVLAADEATLVAIGHELDATPAIDDAFACERAVWRGVLPRLERDELPPGLATAVVRQLGAIADDPSTLRTLLTGDATAFAAALRRENLQALEDRDAASRCIAHEWLVRHGGPVPDYDPLGEPTARKQALAARANAEEAAR